MCLCFKKKTAFFLILNLYVYKKNQYPFFIWSISRRDDLLKCLKHHQPHSLLRNPVHTRTVMHPMLFFVRRQLLQTHHRPHKLSTMLFNKVHLIHVRALIPWWMNFKVLFLFCIFFFNLLLEKSPIRSCRSPTVRRRLDFDIDPLEDEEFITPTSHGLLFVVCV